MLHRPFGESLHLTEAQQLNPDVLKRMFRLANTMRSSPEQFSGELYGQRVGILFSEPSSRTLSSFQEAVVRLGGHAHVRENMRAYSSVAKGESLYDTVRTYMQLGMQYFIIRWHVEHSMREAAEAAGDSTPLINGGDGPGQHPTQAILDWYTIWRENPDLDREMTLLFSGDGKNGRTIHSDLYIAGMFPNKRVIILTPSTHRVKRDLVKHLRERKVEVLEILDEPMLDVVKKYRPDALYATRPQLERERSEKKRQRLEQLYEQLTVTLEVANEMPKGGIIQHPYPRNQELRREVDRHPCARYEHMIGNGLWVRMAILFLLKEALLAHNSKKP